jgi:hypothetical protein
MLTKGSTTELFGVFFAAGNAIVELSVGRGGGGIAGAGASLHYILSGTDTALHHLLVAYDGASTANIPTWYVDAANVANNSGNAGTGAVDTNTNGWNVGNAPSGTLGLDGVIDSVAVWSAIMPNLASMAAALNAGASPLLFTNNLVLCSHLLDTGARDVFSGASTVTGTAFQAALKKQIFFPTGTQSGVDLHSAVTVPTFFQGSQPDYVPRVYSFLAPALAHAWLNPVADTAPTFFQSLSPYRVLPAAALAVSSQLAATAIPPAPEKPLAQPFTVAPDRIDRTQFTAERQRSSTTIPPQPERKAPIASVVVPDAIARHAAHASRQLAATSEPPVPERSQPLASVSWPDRIDIRGMHAAAQLAATGLSPQPEQPLSEPSVTFPDRVPRSVLPAAALPFVASAPLAPERTTPLSSVSAPDRIEPMWRPELRDWLALYPLPLPASTVPALSVAVYPDAVRRGGQPSSEQQAWTGPHLPPAVPTFFQGYAPERVYRPFLLPDRQQAWAGPTAPVAAAAPTFFAASFPDIITRAAPTLLRTETTRSLAPERTAPLAAVVAPDALLRRARGPEHMQASAFAPAPERTAPIVVVEAPSRVPRWPIAQPSASSLPPAPEGRLALDWQATWPESLRRAGALATPSLSSPLDLAALAPMPSVVGPDAVRGAALPVGARGGFALPPAFVVAPVPAFFEPSFPDAARAPVQHAALYQLGLPGLLPPDVEASPIITIRLGQESPTGTLLPLVAANVLPPIQLTVVITYPRRGS